MPGKKGKTPSKNGAVAKRAGKKKNNSGKSANEERLEYALDASRIAVWDWDLQNGRVYFDPLYYTMLGFEPNEFPASYRSWSELLHPEDREATEKCVQEHLDQLKEGFDVEFRMRTRDGGWRWILGRGRIVDRDEQGKPLRMIGTHTDISEVKRAEEELRLKSLVLDQINDMVTVTDLDGFITYVNDAEVRSLGRPRSELLGQSVRSYGQKEGQGGTQQEIIERTREQGSWRGEIVNYSADGREILLDCRVQLVRDEQGRPLAMCGIATDISANRRAEEEREKLYVKMQQAQKLESLGLLAGGIAHDFNNLLTAIMGHLELGLMNMPVGAPARRNLEQSLVSSRRAADLARQMLAYSGKGRFVIESIGINDVLREMLQMLEVSISKKARLELKPAEGIPAVEADITQLRQVIMNLVINASESLEDREGVIRVSTGKRKCSADYLHHVWNPDELPAGEYVYLEVADEGCGMEAAVVERIFDPFYSTKFTGRGLGLPAVLGIVRGHRGTIRVKSKKGRGSVFTVLLPALEKATGKPGETMEPSPEWQARGRVLLVDDEEAVLEVTREMLQRLGLEVITARDGLQALEILRTGRDFACVVLDLTMPRLDGEETFRRLKTLRPGQKVLLASGYNEQEVVQRFLGSGLNGFIQKPFQFSTLRDKLRAVLESGE